MPHMLSRSRALIAALALVVSGALSQGVVAVADAAATTTPACTDSWASPVSGSWANPAMWTSGVPSGTACITVPGTYQVTLPGGDTFVDSVVLGDGSGAGQESLVLPGCAAFAGANNRLFLATSSASFDVVPGGIVDMQDGQSCPSTQAGFTAILANGSGSTMSLGGTVLTEGSDGTGSDVLVAGAITNTGTITDNAPLQISATAPTMTFDNRGVIGGSDFFGLEVPANGVTMTNEGSIQGGVSFFNTSGELGSTPSTFANDTGGDIGPGGLVQMGTGTTFFQNGGTMSGGGLSSGGGLAAFADGSSLDIAGSGPANFAAFGTVAMTGDIHAGQELDIFGQSWSGGGPCGSPVDATVNATGSFTNGGTIVLRSSGSTSCPPGTATLAVPSGEVITNQGTISASQYNALAGRTISGTVDNAGTISVDPGVKLAVSPGAVDNAGTVQLSGTLEVSGGYTQEAAGTTSVAAGSKFGAASVTATGAASLAGTLALAGDGTTPPEGSSATLVSAGSVSGTFGTVTGTDAGNGLTYQVGYTPTAVQATVAAANPPRAYTISSAGSLHVIDRSTNKVLSAVSMGGPGDALAVTPDGSRVYVADDKNRLDVFDTAAGTTGPAVPLGGSPDSVAVSPDGSTVYAADAAGHLDVVSAATGTVKSVVKAGGVPEGIAVSPDGSTVYVADATGRLDVVSTVTDTVKSVIKTGGTPSSVAVSPDGSTVYLASATGQLIAVAAATGTVTTRVKVGGTPVAVAVSPDGSSVYVADPTGRLVVVNAGTGTVARRIALAGAPNAVAVSPDGSAAYVTGAKTTKLYVIGTATGHVQATVPVGAGAMGVALS
jgi:YVTN family beta-propeller protein